VWQTLRQELHPKGLEVVTVALDTGGAEAARPWIEAAHPEHPSLVDTAHVVDEVLGVVNVPNALWIDESGIIVRPAEPAWIERLGGESPGRAEAAEPSSEQAKVSAAVRAETAKMRIDPPRYRAMIDDWVEHGSASQYVLLHHEVIGRSEPRSADGAQAAAHFEIGQFLHRDGRHPAAIEHWREAHRLQPDNWTYKRQAWSLEAPDSVGHIEAYGTGWLEDVHALGAENYYPEIVP
jgi:hypothetical protein